MPRCARPPRFGPTLLLGLATLLASGCVSVRLIEPGADFVLEAGEGILVMDIDTEVEIASLGFGTATAAKDLAPGRHFYLLAVSGGRYRWNRVSVPDRAGREARFLLTFDDITYFQVEPGLVNYPGQHVIWGRTEDDWVQIGGAIRNRSAEAARRLIEDYPELLERHPLAFAGPYRDDFLAHLSRQRAGRAGHERAGGEGR